MFLSVFLFLVFLGFLADLVGFLASFCGVFFGVFLVCFCLCFVWSMFVVLVVGNVY